MFDMGFLELVVIGVIALIVLGPERLPKAARTVGLWVGKAKQSFNSIKNEIDRELKVQELQEQLKHQKEKLESQIGTSTLQDKLSKTVENMNQIADDIEQATGASDKSGLTDSAAGQHSDTNEKTKN